MYIKDILESVWFSANKNRNWILVVWSYVYKQTNKHIQFIKINLEQEEELMWNFFSLLRF